MKKFYSLLALLMMTFVSTSAQENWLVDGTEYFFQNVASDYWLGGGNSWGTQVSLNSQPQNFKAVRVSDGVYKLDSHQYNGANNHFLNTAYLDNGGCNWSVIAVGDGTYYLKSADNKYLSLGENPGAPAAFLDAPTENSTWRIYSYDAVAARMETATIENPAKITELIEANTLKRNTVTTWYKPWTLTEFSSTTSVELNTGGGAAEDCGEAYHFAKGFKAVQTVKRDLRPGVYKFTAQAFYRQDGGDKENFPYFDVNGTKSYFPEKTGDENSKTAALASFRENKYPIAPIFFNIAEGDTAFTIEVANKNATMWTIFGEMNLYYLGDSADAFQAWLDEFLAAKPDYAAIEYKTSDIYAEYDFALQDYSTASNYDELQTAMAAINKAEEALKTNVAAWNELIAARDDAQNNVVNNEKIVGPDKENLGDYIINTINGSVLNEKNATNAELAEYIAEIKRLQAIAVANGMEAGTDVTYMLKCPNMDNVSYWGVNDPTKGWVVEGDDKGGEWMMKADAKCAQCWNGSAYDVYQVVEGAPVGIYEISLQGFYRPGRGDQAYGFYFNQDGSRKKTPEFGNWKENKSYIYMNDAQTLLDNVWNYGQTRDNLTYDLTDRANKPYAVVAGNDTTWYCNDMGDAGKAFDAGAYKVSAYGLVAEEGDVMRVGIKGDNYKADNWTIFTRFRLTYQRFDETVMSKFLATEIEKAEGYLSELFGYDKRQALTQAIADAKAATEGEAMFSALKALVAVEKELAASIAKFDTLTTKMGNLEEAINNYEAIATEEAVGNASELLEEVLQPALPPSKKAENVDITDEQATQYIQQIDELIAALKIPAAIGSDDDPADYTSMIANYDYSTGNGDGWTLENKTGNNNYSNNAAEYYQGTYNHYQDIKNLPAGTYMVSNQGFYRWANATEDFDSVKAEVPSLASMYVKVFTDETEEVDSVACPLRHTTAEAVVNNPDITGQTTAALFGKEYDDTPWYMPNSMESFSNWIKSNKEDYQNQIIVKVAEGQTLRIGVAQTKSVGGGWAIFTNWTLTAYGPESAKEEGVLTSSYADYKPTLNAERATVRKALNDAIEDANAYLETMEDGEAKEELSLAITTAKGVLNGTEKTEATEATKSTDYSNDDVVAATNALKTAYEKATGIDGVSVKADKAIANGKYFKGGKLIIVKNGKTYSATGAAIK